LPDVTKKHYLVFIISAACKKVNKNKEYQSSYILRRPKMYKKISKLSSMLNTYYVITNKIWGCPQI
jgi:hypothetical protein